MIKQSQLNEGECLGLIHPDTGAEVILPFNTTEEVDTLIRAAFKVREKLSEKKKTFFEQAGGKIVPDPYSKPYGHATDAARYAMSAAAPYAKPPIVPKKTVDYSPEAAIDRLITLAHNGLSGCDCGDCRRDRSIVNRRLKTIREELLDAQEQQDWEDFTHPYQG